MSKILVCIGQSNSGPMVVNYLQQYLPLAKVIREEKEDRKKFIKRRVKRYGYFKVFGQLIFMALIPRLLKGKAAPRISQLLETYKTSTKVSDFNVPILDVKSMNTPASRTAIQELKPDLILVVGTRIIGKKTLACHQGAWINIHVGITPLFRGVHGGYWSQVIGEKFGTTIHHIDEGIDTGLVIFQKELSFEKQDNFLTYPYLHMLGILDDLKGVITDMLEGKQVQNPAMYTESRLWTHPTIWQYIYYRLIKGIK